MSEELHDFSKSISELLDDEKGSIKNIMGHPWVGKHASHHILAKNMPKINLYNLHPSKKEKLSTQTVNTVYKKFKE